MKDPSGLQRDTLELGLQGPKARVGQRINQGVAEPGALPAVNGLDRPEIGQRSPEIAPVDRLAQQPARAKRIGNDRAVVAAQEKERNLAALQLMADRETRITVQVDVDDSTIDLAVLKELESSLDTADGARHVAVAIPQELAQRVRCEVVVFQNENSELHTVGNGHCSLWADPAFTTLHNRSPCTSGLRPRGWRPSLEVATHSHPC